jgi:hypothetical protein
MIGQDIIRERVIKKNLDVRENLNKPKIVQYIGGLVNAQMLVIGGYSSSGDEIVITTQIVDATEGKIIRTYRFSGLISNIDGILRRIASDISLDTQTWKKMGGLAINQSVSHRLGTLVADAEKEIESFQKTPDHKKDTPRDYVHYLRILLNANLTLTDYTIREIKHIIDRNGNDSYLARFFGLWFLILAHHEKNAGNIVQAEQNFQHASWFLPENEKILLEYADFYKDINNTLKAIEIYMSYIQNFPDNGLGYAKIADLYLNSQSYSLAIFFAARGISKAPQTRELYVILAKAYVLNDRIDKAIATLREGLKMFPDDTEMKQTISSYYTQTGLPYPQKYRNSISEYE